MSASGNGSASASKKTVALCVTGSIAAYKAVEVARRLVKEGLRVVPVMTEAATKFIGPLTFSGITGEAVHRDMWDPNFSGEMHVAIADRVDAIAIVPATADVIARMAQGRADDLVSALVLCAKGPILCAPAMHPRMWSSAATQRNVRAISDRVAMMGPVDGEVASGDRGMGRMAEPEEIARAIMTALTPDLAGVRLLVTAGPTHEAIDPVRYIANRSSGAMGFAIAERAAARGAKVTLIAGPVSRETPARVHRVDVVSARDMQAAVARAAGKKLAGVDAIVMCAAVGDFRPEHASLAKLKKNGKAPPEIALTLNPDVLASLGETRGKSKSPMLVGFALETGDDDALLSYARAKLTKKKVDLIVANHADEALGTETNRVLFVTKRSADHAGPGKKAEIADLILDRVRAAAARS